MVKNLPAKQETWVRSLGWEDILEKGKATHSSVLAWRIPWTKEPGGLQSMGSQRVGHDDTVYVSIPTSQSIPPSPSPIVNSSLFSPFASLLLPCEQVHQ